MNRCLSIAVAMGLCAGGTPAGEPAISAERIRADVKYLASDRLEGRGIGTLGEERTVDYIAAEFAKAGLKPALTSDNGRGTYFQGVPLVKVSTEPTATLSATKGDETIRFALDEEFVGTSRTQEPLEDFDAE